MLKRFFLFIVLTVLVLTGFWFWEGKNLSKNTGSTEEKKVIIHHAGLANLLLDNIRINAFYFVPKDLASDSAFDYQNVMSQNLSELKKFYEQQTQNQIKINYNIYPKILYGLKTSAEYDVGNTNKGNPSALANISREIEERMSEFQADLLTGQNGEYKVIVIFYEGVGSSATILTEDPEKALSHGLESIGFGEISAALVSKFYFTGEGVSDYASSILAHEFGHTLGFEDGYNIETGEPFTADIMGSGRNRPLEWTFISRENLGKIGLVF